MTQNFSSDDLAKIGNFKNSFRIGLAVQDRKTETFYLFYSSVCYSVEVFVGIVSRPKSKKWSFKF